jgi:hypothetical protein
MAPSCNSPFAIVLLLYERNQRAMLSETQLAKIAKKYSSKPNSLLADLQKKYPHYTVPTEVLLMEVERLLAVYPVPKVYQDLIINDLPTPRVGYNPQYDILSSSFDPLKALSDKIIIAGRVDVPPLDNMTKAWRLLPGSDTTALALAEKAAIVGQKRVASSQKSVSSNPSKKVVSVENRIAADSCREDSDRGRSEDSRSDSLAVSPFSLLLQLMQNREKATIIIRRRNR